MVSPRILVHHEKGSISGDVEGAVHGRCHVKTPRNRVSLAPLSVSHPFIYFWARPVSRNLKLPPLNSILSLSSHLAPQHHLPSSDSSSSTRVWLEPQLHDFHLIISSKTLTRFCLWSFKLRSRALGPHSSAATWSSQGTASSPSPPSS